VAGLRRRVVSGIAPPGQCESVSAQGIPSGRAWGPAGVATAEPERREKGPLGDRTFVPPGLSG